MSRSLAVIGAGAWGTALACLLAEKGERVRLWAFEPEVAAGIVAAHENKLYLPGVSLPAELETTTSLEEAVFGVEAVIFVVPSHAAASVAASLATYLPAGAPAGRRGASAVAIFAAAWDGTTKTTASTPKTASSSDVVGSRAAGRETPGRYNLFSWAATIPAATSGSNAQSRT